MSYAVLCADIGTSSLKAALISCSGDVLCTDTEKLSRKDGSDRWYKALSEASRYMMNQLLMRAYNSSNKEGPKDNAKSVTTPAWNKDCQKNLFQPDLFSRLPEIKAIAISGNGPNLANSGGSFLWNDPFTPGEVAAEMAASPEQHSLYIPRILHVKHSMPEMWNCGEKIFSVPEYLAYQLTGKASTLLPEERFQIAYWKEQDLLNFGIPENKLPPLRLPGKPSGTLKKELAAEFGLNMNPYQTYLPEIYCCGPDFSTALIGTGTITPGSVCARSGATESISICSIRPFAVKGIRTLPSPQAPFWTESVLHPDMGARFQTWKKLNLMDEFPDEECTSYLLKHQDSDGFKLLLQLNTELLKCYRHLYGNAMKCGVKPAEEVATSGGQAKNPVWMQMKADITGLTFKVPSCPDAELLGNACIALAGLKEYSSLKATINEIVKFPVYYRPNPEKSKKFRQLIAAQGNK